MPAPHAAQEDWPGLDCTVPGRQGVAAVAPAEHMLPCGQETQATFGPATGWNVPAGQLTGALLPLKGQ